tara:strand:- start:34176 stop:34553 length:378 start_codon:yes stop_codon:yes gene_type:complete
MAEKKATTKKAPKASVKKQSNSFAVIATGGKQYLVREGDFLNIERLSGEYKEGGKVTFDEVLLVDDGKTTQVGEPTISGTTVTATFVENGRSKKIPVIRFRAKSRYFKNRGHRQPYTRVKIGKIG